MSTVFTHVYLLSPLLVVELVLDAVDLVHVTL
jgi:hypothetical protein